MPAAAVIPAPIAYIKVVAVKKLVVEFWGGSGGLPVMVCTALSACPFLLGIWRAFIVCVSAPGLLL